MQVNVCMYVCMCVGLRLSPLRLVYSVPLPFLENGKKSLAEFGFAWLAVAAGGRSTLSLQTPRYSSRCSHALFEGRPLSSYAVLRW